MSSSLLFTIILRRSFSPENKKGEQNSIVLSLDKYLLLYSFLRNAGDIHKYI